MGMGSLFLAKSICGVDLDCIEVSFSVGLVVERGGMNRLLGSLDSFTALSTKYRVTGSFFLSCSITYAFDIANLTNSVSRTCV